MSKQSYYCPYDNETKIVRLPDETDNLYTQVINNYSKEATIHASSTPANPSKVFKFCKCKTTDVSKLRESKELKPHYSNSNIFYKAKDIWEFDNIGVSKPPSDLKEPEIFTLKAIADGEVHNFAVIRYLVCGHCDRGAFGFGGYLMDLEELNKRIEVGFDLSSVNPNELVYFFYL